MRDAITEHEGTPYSGGRENEERRDVFAARIDWGASVVIDGEPPTIGEPVYTIAGDGQYKRQRRHDEAPEWSTGSGTGLRVARSSIPALMRVLADLLDDEPSFGEG
jgi:hypothetical protein